MLTVHSVQYGTQTIEYKIQRKPKLKNCYISVDRDGVLVKANETTPISDIEQFVTKKSAWILKNLQTYKAKTLETKIETGSRLYYLGKSYYVEIAKEDDRKKIEVEFIHSKFIIHTPLHYSQLALHQAIDDFYKERAISKITPLTKKWSKVMSVTPEHISFRKANKRWGSCSPANRISFNYHLMKVSTALIEYVVVHELSHIVYKNHSKEFWGLVGKFMPEYRDKEEKIKSFEKLI